MTKKTFQLWVAAFSLTAATIASPVYAEDAAEVSKSVNKFIQQGQFPEAMQKADAYLSQHPKDAQVRFLKGLIFAEQNKPNDAIAIFTRLTEDYPSLPEPYNNLAVLYASTNQYDKARSALETAIRTNPSYGTAHENLGDVYAKLASQSYDKALQLDSGNSGAKVKLTLIRNLFGNTNSAIAANATNATTTPAAHVAIATPVVDNKNKPATLITPAPAKPVPAKTEVAKVDDAAKTTKPAAAKPEVKTVAVNTESDDVLKVVDAWAAAWSNKNTNAYLAFYGKDFELPKGMTHKSWADGRRARIEGKGHISVKVSSPKVTISGNTATVKYRQIYNSDQLKADSRKTLVLSKQNGKWQITQERAGG